MKPIVITFEDTAMLRDGEGFRAKAYPDPLSPDGKPLTIAWGLTGPWVKEGLTLTIEEATVKFMEVVNEFCNQLFKLIKVDLNKNQFLAVLSLVYNIGLSNFKTSKLLKELNLSHFTLAAKEFPRWKLCKGVPSKGLLNRRLREQKLFLS